MTETLDNPRILIVDDDPKSRLAVRSVLEGLDLEVVEAETGEAALREVLRQEFTLIVLDIRLPGIDGFETARVIREREKSRSIPIIFLTGIEEDEIQVNRGYQLDAVDYMIKPVNVESFRAKIRFIVEYRRDALSIALEREKAAEKLSELVTELEHSNRELDEFAYTASHDLKEPLRGIAINANFLAREDVSDEARKRIDRMVALTARMERLISDLLQFSRLGSSERVMKDIDPAHLIEGTEKELTEWIQDRNGEVTVVTPLPWLYAERSKIKTLFQNLIVNGLKYNDSEHKSVQIGFLKDVDVEGATLHDVFYVQDNGIGIEEKHHDKVFKIFNRLNREADYGSGTGAGLSFVRKIIEEYGGEVTLISEPGEGATFYFPLPLADTGSNDPSIPEKRTKV